MTVLGTTFDHSVHGVAAVPEPVTLPPWLAGLAALIGWGRRSGAGADGAG